MSFLNGFSGKSPTFGGRLLYLRGVVGIVGVLCKFSPILNAYPRPLLTVLSFVVVENVTIGIDSLCLFIRPSSNNRIFSLSAVIKDDMSDNDATVLDDTSRTIFAVLSNISLRGVPLSVSSL